MPRKKQNPKPPKAHINYNPRTGVKIRANESLPQKAVSLGVNNITFFIAADATAEQIEAKRTRLLNIYQK